MIGRLALLTGLTLAGALLAIALGLPVPLLTGPAIITTLACLAGLPLVFPPRLRSGVFLLAGIAIGATVSADSLSALLHWPIAFAILAVTVIVMILLGQQMMRRMMPADPRSALLAATPGHLSFVMAFGEDLGLSTERIAVVQSIRLLALTLFVPFAVQMTGLETGVGLAAAAAAEMSLAQTLICAIAALGIVPVMAMLRAPAPALLAGMVVGAVARLSGFAPGGMSHLIAYPVLAAVGALIGTRFAGITLDALRRSALAGVAGTTLAAGLTLAAAWITAPLIGMPLPHVLVAFAPGGLETMAVLGGAIGANPGFVAAAHVGRLLLLSTLVPLLMRRQQDPLPAQR